MKLTPNLLDTFKSLNTVIGCISLYCSQDEKDQITEKAIQLLQEINACKSEEKSTLSPLNSKVSDLLSCFQLVSELRTDDDQENNNIASLRGEILGLVSPNDHLNEDRNT